jgi:hypothetical protein
VGREGGRERERERYGHGGVPILYYPKMQYNSLIHFLAELRIISFKHTLRLK